VNITVTLIAQMIAFIVMIWLVNKFLWAPVSGLLQARQKRIADGLAAAEKGKHEQELAEKRALDALKESKAQAADIIAQAQKRASDIIEEAKTNARGEADRIISAANAEIATEVNQAKEHLREQVSGLVIDAAGQVLKREINAKAHEQIIKDVAAKI
jgi:F-type H+-transporting ATPase subunit b